MANHSGITGMGRFSFWGLSPAQDLLKSLGKEYLDTHQNIRMLLIGQNDMRHVLKTISDNVGLLKEKNVTLEIFLAEDYLEQLARQLLFWELAVESELGLHEKTQQFMELFGNTLIRPQTKSTLLNLIPKLIRKITDESVENDIFDFSDMKYREKDYLMELIKHWGKGVDSKFSVNKDWDKRVALHLGTRYDSKFNIYDWDYQMKLKDRGGDIIADKEYKKWRDTGIGFADFDSDYSQCNTTLVSVFSKPNDCIKTNYVGEIVTGPFITYGIETNNEKLYEKVNDKFNYKSFDITSYNIETILTKLNQAKEDNIIGKNVKVHFISPTNFGKIWMRSKYTQTKFDLIYFGNSMVQHMQSTLSQTFVENARILVENAYFALEFRKDQIELFDEKVEELAVKMNLKKVNKNASNNPTAKSFISFVYSSENVIPDGYKETVMLSCPLTSKTETIQAKSEESTSFGNGADFKIEKICKEAECMKITGESVSESDNKQIGL